MDNNKMIALDADNKLITKAFNNMTTHHKKVSRLKTPKGFIKKKN